MAAEVIPRPEQGPGSDQFAAPPLRDLDAADEQPVDDEQTEQGSGPQTAGIVDAAGKVDHLGHCVPTGLLKVPRGQVGAQVGVLLQEANPPGPDVSVEVHPRRLYPGSTVVSPTAVAGSVSPMTGRGGAIVAGHISRPDLRTVSHPLAPPSPPRYV